MLLLTQSYNSSLSICISNETIELPYFASHCHLEKFNLYKAVCRVAKNLLLYYVSSRNKLFNKMCSLCLFPVVDKSRTSCYQLVTRFTRPTDSQQVVPTSLISSACKARFIRRILAASNATKTIDNAQVVTGLQTICYKSVHKLSTSCVRTACSQLLQQVWNKLLTTCNKLDSIIRLVTRLF
jgi:hypothetical protein